MATGLVILVFVGLASTESDFQTVFNRNESRTKIEHDAGCAKEGVVQETLSDAAAYNGEAEAGVPPPPPNFVFDEPAPAGWEARFSCTTYRGLIWGAWQGSMVALLLYIVGLAIRWVYRGFAERAT
ncbi:hypothetical protein ABIE62_001545 [Porphyrobacter sp. MBR-155]|uniref:hypothetical protein n=1 Tax=Porphyrobacter sp. MBR-155 TaxID=3156464 RepID=UPI00339A97F9